MSGGLVSSEALSELASLQQPLMDTIDELRRHQIDKIVDLPQIIVVGNQSSGKSSVLSAISRIQFPAKSTVCTRFAIELVMRKRPDSCLVAVIFRTDGSFISLGTATNANSGDGFLAQIIEDAGKKMRNPSGFSEDVLHIEIHRPDVPHLTLIDLPGFYHSENEEQSVEGRLLVERLTDKYMRRPTSIVLAIVAASNDMIQQSVLSKVRQHDKGGRRTLGIITKPDLLLGGSRGEMIVQLAQNNHPSHKLDLGWHVLRNRDESEMTDSDNARDEKERELFARAPWNTLRSADRGVARLRTKLSTILMRHIQQNLPDLDSNIRTKLDEYQVRLKSLGEPRTRPADLRAFLDRVASRYHTICCHALEGNYSDDFFGGLYSDDEESERIRKLRALVRDLNRAFTYVLGRKGARRRFLFPKVREPESTDSNDGESRSDEEDFDNSEETAAFIGGWEIRAEGEIQRLTLAYTFPDPVIVPVSQMAQELDRLASRNQGNELPGTFSDALAIDLFRDQIRAWEDIANFHVQHVTRFAKAFVEKAMFHVMAGGDEMPYQAIMQHLVDPFFEEQQAKLKEKVQELLVHYKYGHPQPFDPEFETLFADARHSQTTGAAATLLNALLSTVSEDMLSEKGKSLLAASSQAATESSSGDQSNSKSLDVIAKCETYYQMSIYSFINNVIILAVENCLIRKLPSLLSTEMVSRMEDEQLRLLASESPSAQLDRAVLQRKLEALTEAAKALRPYRARSIALRPSSSSSEAASVRSKTPTSMYSTVNHGKNRDLHRRPHKNNVRDDIHDNVHGNEDSDGTPGPHIPEPKPSRRAGKGKERPPLDPSSRSSTATLSASPQDAHTVHTDRSSRRESYIHNPPGRFELPIEDSDSEQDLDRQTSSLQSPFVSDDIASLRQELKKLSATLDAT